MSHWLVDGRWQDALPAGDRGLQYGDGLFETIGCAGGRPLLWQRHLERLVAGCRRLGIPAPDPELLLAELREVLGEAQRAVVKLILTRGEGGRGYRPPPQARPRRLLSRHPLPAYPLGHWRDGVRVRYCETRLSWQPALAGLKHLNRLDQVLARAEWEDPAIVEGLMLDHNGCVVEGTMTNLFILRDEGLATPPLTGAGVAGVMRAQLRQLAEAQGLAVTEQPLTAADLAAARELFLCNSLIGLWPVARLADAPAPSAGVARKLLQELCASDCFPYAQEVGHALA